MARQISWMVRIQGTEYEKLVGLKAGIYELFVDLSGLQLTQHSKMVKIQKPFIKKFGVRISTERQFCVIHIGRGFVMGPGEISMIHEDADALKLAIKNRMKMSKCFEEVKATMEAKSSTSSFNHTNTVTKSDQNACRNKSGNSQSKNKSKLFKLRNLFKMKAKKDTSCASESQSCRSSNPDENIYQVLDDELLDSNDVNYTIKPYDPRDSDDESDSRLSLSMIESKSNNVYDDYGEDDYELYEKFQSDRDHSKWFLKDRVQTEYQTDQDIFVRRDINLPPNKVKINENDEYSLPVKSNAS